MTQALDSSCWLLFKRSCLSLDELPHIVQLCIPQHSYYKCVCMHGLRYHSCMNQDHIVCILAEEKMHNINISSFGVKYDIAIGLGKCCSH